MIEKIKHTHVSHPKFTKLEALYAPYQSMENNPLVIPGAQNMVFGEGNPDADLMFIGEAPGADEDAQGRPFVGRSGQLLTKAIERLGLQREDVFITNIVKTRPPNNRTPSAQEIATGRALLFEQIKIIQPKVICTLGASALAGLNLDNIPQPIRMTKIRGQLISCGQLTVVPAFHPSYVLRNGSQIELLLRDLITAAHAAGIATPFN